MKAFLNTFFICLFLSGCANKINNFDLSDSKFTSNNVGVNVEMDYYSKGTLEFKLIAEEIQEMEIPVEQNIFPKGIKVFVYNNNLDTVARISSDFAIQNKAKKLVELQKNVLLISEEKQELSTELLFWDIEKKIIYTDDFVTLNINNDIIMGHGFLTNQSSPAYSMSNINATIHK